ncbi:XRE family transcriptional regulator [Halovibrio salipaludis]|uniref:XRE family transcriptional regulator n=1 Tax=Halovibrio salipaludis TaxID=2032626 RepID=A0A2A2F7F9_9GAMM|nr:cupin domain-containing protein [Halovibrio salipaludis]PAU80525.1 XRE family transcriptional regulator [Halovibrio salipaludis]
MNVDQKKVPVAVTKDPYVPKTLATRVVDEDRQMGLESYIGTVLRQTRINQELTIADVAELAGLSRGMVSKIENGQVATSLDSLARLTSVLGLTLSQLFRDYDSPEGGAQHVKAGDGLEVVRRGTKKGHTYHLLAYNRGHQRNFEPFLISMDDESEAFPTFQHEGVQFIYMLEGQIDYRHGQHVYTLEPGDSFTFDAQVPHGPERLNRVPIRFLAMTVFSQKE